jgi:hypothetical protein
MSLHGRTLITLAAGVVAAAAIVPAAASAAVPQESSVNLVNKTGQSLELLKWGGHNWVSAPTVANGATASGLTNDDQHFTLWIKGCGEVQVYSNIDESKAMVAVATSAKATDKAEVAPKGSAKVSTGALKVSAQRLAPKGEVENWQLTVTGCGTGTKLPRLPIDVYESNS